MKTLGNVSFIVIGVVIASFGEIQFVMTGFLFQAGGIVFEAIRLCMVERLLSSAEFKMDPLVSLYYYAPACAIMNGFICLFTEARVLTLDDIYRVGCWTLTANAMVAFLLNVSVVFLVCQSRAQLELMLTISDWQDLVSRPDSFWCAEGYSPRLRLHDALQRSRQSSPGVRLQHCPWRSHLLQAWRR
jgi:hypothetical protein